MATLVFVQACAEIGLRNAEALPVAEMAVSGEVLSLSLSDHKDLLEEAAVAGSVSQQCFLSSRQHGLVEPGHAAEAQLVERPRPIAALVAPLHRSDMLVDEHLVVSGHCAG